MEPLKKKILSAQVTKGEGDKKGLFQFIISDGLLDRHYESINPEGWDFSEFNANPVALVGHDYGQLPVGKWLPPVVQEGAVLAYLDLADTDRGNEARYLIENDFLKTVSVGFRVEQYGGNGDSHTIMKQKLYEVSLVSIPANTRAERVKDARALEVLAKMDKEMEKKEDVVMVDIKIIKDIIVEALKEVINGVKVIEEKTVEKIVYMDGKPLSNPAMMMIFELKKQHDKIEKKQDRASQLLKSLLNIKNSTEGGDTQK
jgi:HK97 family phage prohead protease